MEVLLEVQRMRRAEPQQKTTSSFAPSYSHIVFRYFPLSKCRNIQPPPRPARSSPGQIAVSTMSNPMTFYMGAGMYASAYVRVRLCACDLAAEKQLLRGEGHICSGSEQLGPAVAFFHTWKGNSHSLCACVSVRYIKHERERQQQPSLRNVQCKSLMYEQFGPVLRASSFGKVPIICVYLCASDIENSHG